MIGSTRSLRVWAYPAPADLRTGFDGLSGVVLQQLHQDPLSGDCCLFLNRTRPRAKVLLWDGTGLCIYHKRLELGRFSALWKDPPGQPVTLMLSALSLFLEGCTLVARVPLSPPPFLARQATETTR
ncbi:MAG TPA: IS66 family insertion sequence element accessory protein TnpB [Candidatus Acidoferrales bacterium]|nr:IS66 family insertion sequence element accessory protein TnpB [Candidatus Acidoferrales bacterium]